MENFPLNKAHQLGRRADALYHQKKFNECKETHQQAADCLKLALSSTDNPRSIESIQLQIDHHLKQSEVLKIKKLQFEHHNQLSNKETMENKNETNTIFSIEEKDLETMIFRTMDIHDSLVEYLIKRGQGDEENKDVCDGLRSLSIRKHKVDDSTIIEEFKELSEKLRESVQSLLILLEKKDKEIEGLKTEVHRLKSDTSKKAKDNVVNAVTEPAEESLPFMSSCCSENNSDAHDVRSLPLLAPLGVPNFDFTTFNKLSND